MKKALIALAVVALLAGLGAVGYIVASELLAPQAGEALPVAASGEEAGQGGQGGSSSSAAVRVNYMKPVKTAADILDAADYEYSKNPDTVGWLNIPGTDISSSVLQSFDNAYYLRRDERRQEAVYGCYFADYTCSFGTREQLSPNTVIYGHSDLKDNPDGPRFSQLFRFTDPEFAASHPTASFSTREELMTWQIFAVLYTDFSIDFANADLDGPSLVRLAGQAKERSLYQYPVSIGEDDRILTLVTCTVKYGAQQTDQRFLVMAKLMPEGSAAGTRTELTVNPSPVQPNFQ